MLNADTSVPAPSKRGRDSVNPESFGQLVQFSIEQIDKNLPIWARRSHPIARRHLGAYWKSFTPNLTALSEMYGLLSLVVIVTMFVPVVFLLIVPTVTVSLVLIPIGGWLYARTLLNIAAFAAAAVADERRNNTLDVLRVTPIPFYEMLLSKGAAAIWRYIEDLNLVVLLHLLPSLPLLLILYHALLRSVEASPIVTGGVVIIALGVFAVRLLLETVMITALAMLMGAVNSRRSAATLATVVLALAYFGMINAARLIPLGVGYTLVIEWVIPTILPVVITLVSLRLTRWLLERD